MIFKKTVTSNNITILSERMNNVRSIALGVWVDAGARDEQEKISGMSHFMEHLMFKGTPTRSAKDISESFDGLGADLNAFTAKESTAFFTRLIDEHLGTGVEILADMLQNSTFEKKEIDAEKQVVLEEISLHEDSPDEMIHDIFSDTLFGGHPLGKRILGTGKSVEAFNREKVIDYFKKIYVPDNMVVTAAGNIDHDDLVSLVNSNFVNNKASKFKRQKVKPTASSKFNLLNKKTEQAHICLGTLGLSATDEDRFVLSILDNILGGGMSSRLFQEIREKRGLAYSVFTYHSVHAETGSFCMYAGTNPKNAKEVIEIMKNEIETIKQKKVTKDELKRVKQNIKGQLVLGLESTTHRMMRLGKSELAHGSINTIEQLIELIDKVTADDVKRLANKLFKADELNLALIGPYKEDDFSDIGFGSAKAFK